MIDEAPNPYEPSRAPLAEPAGDVLPGLDWDEVQAFVGEKCRDFLDVWRTQTRSSSGGFLWPALFLNVYWLLYRKMYREAVVAYLLFIGASTVIARLHVPAVQLPFALGVGLSIGFLGSGFYLRHTRAAIAAARQEQPELGPRLVLLRKRGGTNLLWPLLALAVRLILQFNRFY
jgi:Protein of unknown function (DUF2628)